MSEYRPAEITLRAEPTGEHYWLVTEPDSDEDVYGRGRTAREATINYIRALDAGDELISTRTVVTDGGITREDLTECWCCGGLTERASLCPDCERADCTRFGDGCQADHVPVTDGGTIRVRKPDWIAGHLRAVPVVTWDRFTVDVRDGDQCIDIYGWIDRADDQYKDFVWARFWPAHEFVEYTTSSDRYTEYIAEEWFGEAAGHNECRRIEDAFDIDNCVELGEQDTLVTDGGTQRLPWCPECDAYAVPTDDGDCGDCGAAVRYRGADADLGSVTLDAVETWRDETMPGSPDDRNIDDITAVAECASCGWAPAAVVLVDGGWECYNCGHDPDSEGDVVTDGGQHEPVAPAWAAMPRAEAVVPTPDRQVSDDLAHRAREAAKQATIVAESVDDEALAGWARRTADRAETLAAALGQRGGTDGA